MGKRNPKKNRQTKLTLVFDESERKEFLTGFRKRKLERKEKAKEKIAKKLKEEKTRMRVEKNEQKAKLYLHNTGVPEVDHLIEKVEVIDTESHTVTITSMDTAQIAGQLNFGMGHNTGAAKSSSNSSKEKEY